VNRLLFISNLFPDASEPYRGLDNATLLHALRDRWEVRVIAPRARLPLTGRARLSPARSCDAEMQPRFVGVPYIPKAGGLANHLLMTRALRPCLAEAGRDFRWDVVLASWLFPDGCAAVRLAAERGSPVVLIAQGTDVHGYLKSSLRRRAILGAVSRSAGCITRSRSLAELLAAAGVSREKLHPVVNGIDTAVFAPSGPRADAVPDGARVLLFVGNLLPVKAPIALTRYFAKLVERRPADDLRLVIAGKGPLDAAVREEARLLGVSDRVVLTGPLASPEIAAWMRRAELLCMTSRNEGLPNVILEAQASGLPVLATDVGGIRELVDEPWKGTLAPLDGGEAWVQAAMRMLEEPAERHRIAALGQTRTWKAAADEVTKVLERAMRPSRGAGAPWQGEDPPSRAG
jgi:glycosyltransferase involved in cell wall biosynthesis